MEINRPRIIKKRVKNVVKSTAVNVKTCEKGEYLRRKDNRIAGNWMAYHKEMNICRNGAFCSTLMTTKTTEKVKGMVRNSLIRRQLNNPYGRAREES